MFPWKLVSPWPTIDHESALHDGLLLDSAKDCLNCRQRECALAGPHPEGKRIGTCRKGISYYRYRFDEENFISFNSILLDTHADLATRKNIRKLKGRLIKESEIDNWCNRNGHKILTSTRESNQIIVDYIIHNLQWPLNAALRSAESLYVDLQGKWENEKIDKLPSNQKQLVKALQLIQKCFALAPISVNPDSVKSEELKLKPIFRLFDRFSWIFKDVANLHGKTIRSPIGQSRARCKVHDSFELIPLLLIENAIKYGETNSEIQIKIKDHIETNQVIVSVESQGAEIADQIKEKIFQRGIRGDIGAGSGLGLYFAQKIALMNGTNIAYRFEQPSTNIFELNISAFDFQDKW